MKPREETFQYKILEAIYLRRTNTFTSRDLFASADEQGTINIQKRLSSWMAAGLLVHSDSEPGTKPWVKRAVYTISPEWAGHLGDRESFISFGEKKVRTYCQNLRANYPPSKRKKNVQENQELVSPPVTPPAFPQVVDLNSLREEVDLLERRNRALHEYQRSAR